MKEKNFSELIAWQKALDLVEETYQASKSFPKEEQVIRLLGMTYEVARLINGLSNSLPR